MFMRSAANAQEPRRTAAEGYVTAMRSADRFDVNGKQVSTSAQTRFGLIGEKEPSSDPSLRELLQVGVFVQVFGSKDRTHKSVIADSVLFRDATHKKTVGTGVIAKVDASGSEPVFEADGYRIRISSGAATKFSGDLSSLSDVGPNTWLRFEGKRDATGGVVAARAAFFRPMWAKIKSSSAGGTQVSSTMQAGIIPKDSLLDADGRIVSAHAKVRLSDAGGMCGWHKLPADQSLQDRVRRVGMRLVPAYQNRLAPDNPTRISFRFYVVEEPKIRSDLFCNDGLVLVPRQIVERLQNDDQLAAVLADGVAFNLQRQAIRIATDPGIYMIEGAQLATAITAGLPGLLAAEISNGIVTREVDVKMQEERGRIALSLMDAAGFNPWQAPEAWRLLEPKKLPRDISSLRYPDRSGYQLGILNLQYRKSDDGRAVPGSPSIQ